MAELGFQRSAKKCKEKFENVYKYHKRTKDGRATKSDGKTYRFFDQLEALENAPPPQPFTPPPPRHQLPSTMLMPVKAVTCSLPMPSHTLLSTSPTPLSVAPPIQTSNSPFQPPPPASNPPVSQDFQPHLDSTSSSSTSSDEDIQRRRGKKRKWKDFFHRLMKDVIHKQEDLQKKFLDTLERRERDRMAREEAWRVQEMTRLNREHEFLVQERTIAAAKDAAVMAFLQKVTEQNNLQIPIPTINTPPSQQPPIQPPAPPRPRNPNPPPPLQQTPPPPFPPPPQATPTKTPDASKTDNGGGEGSMAASSSRWPKAEVQALINLRTSLDLKYQENGPKGPLWEEISSAMIKMGYNRSSKRCKEKWENINKYFKKVKESSKKRPEDSKTCSYFHQLDAINRERAKHDAVPFGQAYAVNAEPIMARPEQQWPQPDQQKPGQNHDDERYHDKDDDDEEDEGGGYEMVANKQPSSAAE